MNRDQILTSFLKGGRTSRRDFMLRSAALGLSVTAASGLWHGAGAATPKKGGHLKVGIGGGATSDRLDPATYDATFMITLGNSIRNNMTEIGPDDKIQGGLAESWEPTPDASKWTFTLRQGVEWHDGKPLTPEDVIVSLNLHRGEDSRSGAKGVVSGIKDIKADGKNRVIFELNGPNADFPYILTDYHLNVVPEKDGQAEWRSGNGTGAYILENFEPGVSASVKLNPNRWQEDVGFADSAELLLVNDANARQTAVITGALHAVNRVDLKTVSMLERNENTRVIDVAGRLHHIFPCNMEVAPFNNPDVRMALKLSIDREDYLRRILRGYGTLGNDNPLGPPYRYNASDLPQRSYDPDKARFHLKKAGEENLKLDLSTADFLFSGAVDAAVLYKSHAEKAGIDITVKQQPDDGYYTDTWMVDPWYTSYWGSRATEDMILSIAYMSDAPWNETRQKSPELDSLIVQARGELDEDQRRQLYQEAQSIIRDDGGAVIPAFANMVMAAGKDLGTPERISSSWDLDGGHCVKRWWLTA